MLLVLGAGCLVAAMAAGTAVLWSALGPDGQAALMLAVTAALLAAALRLRRLPATANALAAVGVACLYIDAVAGRSLGVAGLRDLPLHQYAAIAASAVVVVLVVLSRISTRLWAPPGGAAPATIVATVAWMHPTTLDRLAWSGPVVVAAVVALDALLRPVGRVAVAGRVVAVVLGATTAAVGLAAAIVAAAAGSYSGWAGVVLAAAVLVLPEAVRSNDRVLVQASSAASGVILAALLVAMEHAAAPDARVALAGVLAGVAVIVVALPPLGDLAERAGRCAVMLSALSAGAFYASLTPTPRPFAHASLVLSGLAAAVAAGWSRSRPDSADVRTGAAIGAVVLGTLGTDLLLALRHVTVVEPYVAVPAVGLVLLGAAVMATTPSMSSWVLAPGIALGLLPTLHLALHGDVTRQAVIVAAGAALVVVGAQLRLVAPLTLGTTLIALIAIRVVGPEVSQLPHWVALGAVGAVLLTLGATWEAWLLDLHRAAHAVRPRIDALR